MVPLREDGSLDVEFINKLPFDDFEDVISSMTGEQWDYYLSKNPENRNEGPITPIKVDYGFDDPRSGISLEKFLEQKKRKYGIK